MDYRILNDLITNNSITNSSQVTPTVDPANGGHASFLSAKSLVAIVILIIYTISTPIFEKIHFHYIHESGICMLLGLFVGVIAMVINPAVNKHFL
jgi:hypothetical protein